MKKISKLQQLKRDWDNITLFKLFEVPVIDKRTNKPEYIIFDIFIRGRSFIAQHESLNTKQEKSKKIAFVKILLDPDFSLDWNLNDLYEECITAIIDSEFYELSE